MKYTKARRWVAGRPDMGTQTEIYGKAIYADIDGTTENRKYVAFAVEDAEGTPWPEVMGNAYLIAEAPEMLQILQRIEFDGYQVSDVARSRIEELFRRMQELNEGVSEEMPNEV